MKVHPQNGIGSVRQQSLSILRLGLLSLAFAVLTAAPSQAWNEFGSYGDDDKEESSNPYDYESREERLERLERQARRPLGKIEIDLKRPEDVVMNTVADNAVAVFAIIFLIFGGVGLFIYLGGRHFLRPPPNLPRPERKQRDPHARRTRITNSASVSVPLASYSVLGVEANASDEEIRARYKHLVKSFHSDKLASSGLPAEVLALTEEQFRKIQNAYEAIRASRGMQ